MKEFAGHSAKLSSKTTSLKQVESDKITHGKHNPYTEYIQ